MNGSSSTYMHNGSHPLIQGLPSPLVYMEYVLGNAPEILSRAINAAVNEEIDAVREDLVNRNSAYAGNTDNVDITYEDGFFVYEVSGPFAGQAREEEYGKRSFAARPALRTTARKSATRLEKSISNNLKKELGQ